MRPATVSPEATKEARQWGLFGDTEARLRRMAVRSVPVPGSKTVRRFLDWELTFNQDTITHVVRVDLALM